MQNINPDWFLNNKSSNPSILKISRVFNFTNYPDALNFFNQIAHIAIKLNHHPDLSLEYTKLTVCYWTHNAQGLTFVDFEAIREIDGLDDTGRN
jgi:4a-hydroxytetrahydrobiopterin dehydratase